MANRAVRERKAKENCAKTLENRRPIQELQEKSSLLPLTAVHAGKQVAAAERSQNRSATSKHKSKKSFTDSWSRGEEKNEIDKLFRREGRMGGDWGKRKIENEGRRECATCFQRGEGSFGFDKEGRVKVEFGLVFSCIGLSNLYRKLP